MAKYVRWSGSIAAQREYESARATLQPRSKAKRRKKKKNRRATVQRKSKYSRYLRSPWWRERRQKALAHAGNRCEKCQTTYRLEVHHRNYARLGEELDTDLEVLCHDCHADHHLRKVIEKIA
jgi:hypothetical protein